MPAFAVDHVPPETELVKPVDVLRQIAEMPEMTPGKRNVSIVTEVVVNTLPQK
jgi:hypothetical protein